METNRPIIARLNSKTFPITEKEKMILSSINAHIIEIEGSSDDEIISFCQDAESIMIISAYLRGNVIKELKKLKHISRLGIGVDKIDIEQATKQGIMVTNLPDFCTDEVADHTMALLLSAARQINIFEAGMYQGKQLHDVPSIHRLSVQKIGIIGFGRIGKAVAKRAKSFGLTVLAFDPNICEKDAQENLAKLVDFDTILKESDYLCLLCPLIPDTREMITIRELKKMKKSAVLINTGRGELVNENHLVEALNKGIIRYAAIDVYSGINVFAPDGFPTTHPYFGLKNILLTPHVAAYSEESGIESTTKGAQVVVDVLSGRWPENLVNKDVKSWFHSQM